jgi:hypothetical protein
MTHEYKTITRIGRCSEDLAGVMRKYNPDFIKWRMPDGTNLGAVIYLESEGLVVISMLLFPSGFESLDNSLLAVSSHSQVRSAVLADEFEETTGLKFRQAEPYICKAFQCSMDEWIRSYLETDSTIKDLNKMRPILGQIPSFN